MYCTGSSMVLHGQLLSQLCRPDMQAPEYRIYENLAAADTISSLPTYLCLVTLTMNVWTNHECLGGVLDAGGDMDLGIYVNSNRRIIAPYLLCLFNHNIEKT